MPTLHAALLTIGDELLNATVIDTNSTWVEEQLAPLGWNVRMKIAVRDEREDILSALDYLRDRCELIIVTGGLGPTDDDLTRETVSEFFGLELIPDEKFMKLLRSRFNRANIPYPVENDKQALIPVGAIKIENPKGTAPGLIIPQSPTVACFPGVPSELKAMFPSLADYLREKGLVRNRNRGIIIRTVGLPESMIAGELRANPDERFRIGTICRPAHNDIRIDPDEQMDDPEKNVREWLNRMDAIAYKTYAYGASAELEEVLVELLRQRKLTLTVAESCTGGLLGSLITGVSGSSDVFKGGVITYHNDWKEHELGVCPETLTTHGAVSFECAAEMVRGLIGRDSEGLAVSITGIAGPTGGSERKPVGTVFIGFFDRNRIRVYHYRLPGDRAMIRMSSAVKAMELVWLFLRYGDIDADKQFALIDHKIYEV